MVLYCLYLYVFTYSQELKLPFTFMSGHIHELRIHVPWTKLGSEPVVITINTMECILKLRDGAQVSQTEFPYIKHDFLFPFLTKFPNTKNFLIFFIMVSVFDRNVMNLIRTRIFLAFCCLKFCIEFYVLLPPM